MRILQYILIIGLFIVFAGSCKKDSSNPNYTADKTALKAMLDSKFADGKVVTVFAESDLGKTTEFSATVRIDTPQEILYYQNGGILQYVLRQLAGKG